VSEQRPSGNPGTLPYELKAGWRRFWALSWWWKGPTIVVAVTAAFLGAGAVMNTDDQDDLYARTEEKEEADRRNEELMVPLPVYPGSMLIERRVWDGCLLPPS
jgi:hypothetical protein